MMELIFKSKILKATNIYHYLRFTIIYLLQTRGSRYPSRRGVWDKMLMYIRRDINELWTPHRWVIPEKKHNSCGVAGLQGWWGWAVQENPNLSYSYISYRYHCLIKLYFSQWDDVCHLIKCLCCIISPI